MFSTHTCLIPGASALALFTLGAGCSPAPETNCRDGYARDNQGRCQIVEAGTNPDDAIDGSNTPPTAPAVAIRPASPREHGMPLVCQVYAPSVDTDGDDVSYSVTWTLNGEKFGGSATTKWPGDTIPSDELNEGDEWSCTATPHDGHEAGPIGGDLVQIQPRISGMG